MNAQRRHRFFWGAGFGLLAAVGLVVAGPVLSADAADHPNTLTATRGAKATPVNAWQNSDGITSAGDADWYRYDLTARSAVMITLGALPADYSLALYGDDGHVIVSSLHKGKEFERITRTLAAGRYFVRVYSSVKASSSKNYRLRLRVLPAGVFTLDQQSSASDAIGAGGVHATFYNNTDRYQKLNSWTVRTLDAQGKELGSAQGVYDEDMTAGAVWIAPGGTRAVSQGAFGVPKGTRTIVATPVTEPISQPPASDLTIALDPAHKTTRDGSTTLYYVLVTHHALGNVNFIAQVRHYTSIGDLMALGELRSGPNSSISGNETEPYLIPVSASSANPPLPNAVRYSISLGH